MDIPLATLIAVRRRLGIRAVRQLLCGVVVELQGRDGRDLAADHSTHVTSRMFHEYFFAEFKKNIKAATTHIDS
ncbi:MAG: hypothetical protein PVJ44_06760 [Desulfobacterales bacterium]